MTMMAASRQKGPLAAAADPDATSSEPITHVCSRSQEEALLDRIFSNSGATSSGPVVFSAQSSQWHGGGLSQAKAVRVSESLWTHTACCDPPGCQLQERVHKRKAEAELQKQMVKEQALEQRQIASQAAATSCSSQAQGSQSRDAACANKFESSCIIGNAGGDYADCIVLTSPSRAVHAHRTCTVSQPASVEVAVSQTASAQTLDPMKRMRLQALEQELKAAKQTVADLERMIKAVEQD